MFQMGGVGPMLGQAHHFRIYAPEKIEYAVNRYTNEARRLYGVMDKQLGKRSTWRATNTRLLTLRLFRGPLMEKPGHRHRRVSEREALVRRDCRAACGVARRRSAGVGPQPLMDDKAQEVLFGATQYAKH